MTSSQQKRSWLKAIDDASREQGIVVPPFTEIGMGTAIARDRNSGRSVSFKRRLLPASDAQHEGVEWSFWLNRNDQTRTVVTFREPLIPTPQRIAAILPILQGWLLNEWPIEQVEQIAATAANARSQRFAPAASKVHEFWFSGDRAFGLVVNDQSWSIRSRGRTLSEWRSQTDRTASHVLPLQDLDLLCLWIARQWFALAYGSDIRPAALREFGAAASHAYKSTQLVRNRAHKRTLLLGGDVTRFALCKGICPTSS